MRILAVDDNAPLRASLRALLDLEADLELVGEAADGEEGVERAVALRPDVVLLDIEMPRLDGIEAARRIRAELAETHIIFFVAETGRREEAMRTGAEAFLLKDTPIDTILQTIRDIGAPRALPPTPEPRAPSAEQIAGLVEDEIAALRGAAARLNAIADRLLEERSAARADAMAAWSDVAQAFQLVRAETGQLLRDLPSARSSSTALVDAGPFTNLELLSRFVEAVVRLPGVERVEPRGVERGLLSLELEYSGREPLTEELSSLSEFRPVVHLGGDRIRVEIGV